MKPKLKRTLLLLGSSVLLGILWFLFVDFSWFVEECPECHWVADVFEYRICGHSTSTSERVLGESWTYFVTVDLGVPCTHPRKTRWHKHRYWGLCYCAAPCINGLHGLSGDDYSVVSPRVRAWRGLDPELGHRFREALVRGDDAFRQEFFRRLHAGESPPGQSHSDSSQ